MYKLFAIDMDDTLLRGDLSISDKNKNRIEYAANQGVKIVFCSGRSSLSILNYINDLKIRGCDEFLISYNGAMIFDIRNKKYILEKYVEPFYVKELIDYGRKKELNVQLYLDDKIIVEKYDDRTKEYEKLSGLNAVKVRDLKEVIAKGSIKVLFNNEADVLNNIKKELDIYIGEKLNIFFSKPYYLEFLNKNTDKGISLLELAKSLDISKNEIMAIGDSYNDISMIKKAGLGIAMKNGNEEIKKHANYITKNDNDKDGVAEAIEQFIG
ncbi:hypothetical protein EDC19_2826 [Natranaerovirga hydrolytica]|uniref:Cof subfamily protein (Haloacid dehalogenase superfamily)/HAD superfamily hydrolase (TIGR01484 family) n=1 Tax=Natranaerovirga hydrolytica TaxID=680378 RepID=A0A4R1M650_9FIRM|nr:Cof-type HAD-IIB family hydrolase [Natranaerovirga hydrolytica]TCK86772.1 hypothetical protein EDC19_2826 [Natranaerovirga hydrolytica]